MHRLGSLAIQMVSQRLPNILAIFSNNEKLILKSLRSFLCSPNFSFICRFRFAAEHRNMPLDDAMKFVSHNFDSYLQTLREKKRLEAPPDYSRMPDGFLPPSDHVAYLLNLLADGRMLTSVELKEILDFVTVRRDKLFAAEGLPMAAITSQRPSECSFFSENSSVLSLLQKTR